MFCLITGDFVDYFYFHYFYFSLKSGDWSHIQEVETAGTNRVTATAPLQPPTGLLVIMAKQYEMLDASSASIKYSNWLQSQTTEEERRKEGRKHSFLNVFVKEFQSFERSSSGRRVFTDIHSALEK